MTNQLKVNDFALLEGQMVQIKRIKKHFGKSFIRGREILEAQIKLTQDNLLHWVDLDKLEPLPDQIAAKVLFSA
jgi:hypothetical protein